MKAKPYMVLVCGGRDYKDMSTVRIALDRLAGQQNIGAIIQGGAMGADFLASEWARENRIPCVFHWADWERLGNAAGPIRNKQMIEMWNPDIAVAFPGGRGTNGMVALCEAAGIPVIKPLKERVSL